MTLTAHSKHVIIFSIIGLVILISIFKIYSHLDNIHSQDYLLAKQKLESDNQTAKMQAGITSQDEKDLQNKFDTLVASTNDLRATVATLRTQLNTRIKADDNLPPSELSARWQELTTLPKEDIQPSENGFKVTIAGARTTVDSLEEIPVLKQENKTLSDNSDKKDSVILGQQKLVSDKDTEINTCKRTLTDQQDVCKKQIKVEKDKARKRTLFGFVTGFITGFVAGRKF